MSNKQLNQQMNVLTKIREDLQGWRILWLRKLLILFYFSIETAIKEEKWRKAMDDKINSIKMNNT